MLKSAFSVLALSSSLLMSSAYAGNTKCEECHDPLKTDAAAFHYTVSKADSKESKYWEDFEKSKSKDITLYVRDLSRKDAQAALWFITTGGKYGFAARQATEYEKGLLEEAIKHVAVSYSQKSNGEQGLQEWSQVSNANHAGHLHLQMIYKQLDNLNIKVNNLENEVKLLKEANEKTDKKFTALQADLKAERVARTADIDKLIKSMPTLIKPQTDEIKAILTASENNWKTIIARWDANDERDRLERENLRLAAAAEKTNYENKLVAQQLADKTTADAEKAKVQAEVDKQKTRKRIYKEQLADYKEKETEARQAAAIAKALKEEREAAALREKQREEEVRKEREAAAEREKKMQEQMNAMLALLPSGILPSNSNDNSVPSFDKTKTKKIVFEHTAEWTARETAARTTVN